jgi:LPXTG-site transpeptidase (sortase) family protein
MSKKTFILMIIGASLFVTGTISLVVIIRNHAVNIVATPLHQVVAETVPVATTNNTVANNDQSQGYITGMPVRVTIPSLGINLPVIPGYYDAKSQAWTLTTTKVQFATLTSQPNNQSGNTFLYGHARTNLFGKLPKIQAGTEAVVTTDNGHTFYFTLDHTRVVSPSDSDAVLGYAGKPILTLQTCVGLLYQNRELLIFNLARVV